MTINYTPYEDISGVVDSFIYSIKTEHGLDQAVVYVNISCESLIIFNGISPNGDGINDRFGLGVNKGVNFVRSLRIYDRWGEQVYDATDLLPNDLRNGWDGRLNGQPLNPGFYAWTAEVIYLDGEVQVLNGEVMLLR